MIEAIGVFVLLGMAAALFWLVLVAITRLAFRLLIREQLQAPARPEEHHDDIDTPAAAA